MKTSNLSERMHFVMNSKKLTGADLSRLSGVASSSVACWLNGKTKKLKVDVALKLAKELNLNLTWLVEGKGLPFIKDAGFIEDLKPNDEAVVLVPFIDQEKTLFTTSVCTNSKQRGCIMNKSFFNDHNVSTDALVAFQMHNDELCPLISKGDNLIIDTTNTSVKEQGIYLLAFNKTFVVRRIRPLLKGGAVLSSLQPQLEELLSQEDLNDLNVLGRVIYISKEMPV